MKKIGYAGLLTIFCLAFALPVLAQQPAATQPTAVQLACNAKYGAYYAKQDDMALFNAFVNDATCKDSTYREGAYQVMMQKLVAASNWKGAMELVNRFATEVPAATDAGKVYVSSQGLTAAGQTGDIDKILEMGEKVLSVDPNNLNAILIVGTTIPDRVPAVNDPAAKEKLLVRAMELAKKLLAMTKPAALDEKTWQTAAIGPAHSVIGFVLLQRLQYPESAAEYEQAVKINPKDQVSWYRMGLDYYYITIAAQAPIKPAIDAINAFTVAGPERDAAIATKDALLKDFNDKRDKAMDVLATAMALGEPIAKAASGNLETLWKSAHDGSLDGLDDFIAKHK